MSYREEPTYEISFMFRRILVPVDGSETSMRALDLAIDFAKRYGSRVTVFTVIPRGAEKLAEAQEKAMKRIKGEIEVVFKKKEIDYTKASVSSTILEELLQGEYDAIILGARGNTLSTEIQLGSTAASIAFHSPVTVIIVR